MLRNNNNNNNNISDNLTFTYVQAEQPGGQLRCTICVSNIYRDHSKGVRETKIRIQLYSVIQKG